MNVAIYELVVVGHQLNTFHAFCRPLLVAVVVFGIASSFGILLTKNCRKQVMK